MVATPTNSINEATTGITGFTGTAFTGTAATQYNVIVGGATSSTLANVAPAATSGVPLISQGAAANPAFGTAVVAGGGTGVTSTTAYGVICGGTTTTGAFQNAGAGTSGQVLMSNGAAALPSWGTSSGVGAWVFLQSQSASNVASIDFTSKISGTYTTYVVVISKCVPITNAATLNLKVSNDNGGTYIATGYLSGVHQVAYNGSTIGNASSTTFAEITGGIDNTAAMGFCGVLWMHNVGNSNNCMIHTRGVYINGAASQDLTSLSTVTQTAVNAFQFLMSSGNISTGIFTLYGLKES